MSQSPQTTSVPNSWRTRIPPPVKQLFRSVRNGLTRSTTSQLLQWKAAYHLARLRQQLTGKHEPVSPAMGDLKNRLPNSGGFPAASTTVTPESILTRPQDVRKRQTGIPGFEGLALDDALIYTNEYKDYSFLPLARAIASIARERFPRQEISVLELGCGSGQMRRFLQVFGLSDYLGIDANPVAFQHSPHIRQNPDHFRLLDLQQPIDFGAPFDLVCSFEVLEHIREDKLENLLGTIRRHMTEHSLFIGTASLLDQLDVHITVHDRPWWLEQFRQHGLEPARRHAELEAVLERNHPFNWDANNSSLFVMEPVGN